MLKESYRQDKLVTMKYLFGGKGPEARPFKFHCGANWRCSYAKVCQTRNSMHTIVQTKVATEILQYELHLQMVQFDLFV